jgi:hypothetical protein
MHDFRGKQRRQNKMYALVCAKREMKCAKTTEVKRASREGALVFLCAPLLHGRPFGKRKKKFGASSKNREVNDTMITLLKRGFNRILLHSIKPTRSHC